jgi:hypothetical protein
MPSTRRQHRRRRKIRIYGVILFLTVVIAAAFATILRRMLM